MNNYRKGLYAAMFSAVLAGGAAPAFAAGSDQQLRVDVASAAEPVVARQALQGVVVTGNGNPFVGSDRRLAMLNASLPLDTGSSVAHTSGVERVTALFAANPDASVGEARRMMERGHQPASGPDPDGDIVLGAR